MKNRLLSMVIIGALAVSMVACGGKDADSKSDKKATEKTESTKKSDPIEYKASDYVTLGDYKGLEVTLEGEYEYSKEGFEKYLEDAIASAALYVEDSSQNEIKEDSIVNVDYVGSQDGVAFDGGSAEDQTIDVGNNSSTEGGGYIEGFTAGLVGHKVGEEVAYEVKFPDEYGNADLAGQTVTFTFQINYIAKAINSKSDLTDEICADNLGYDTVDEYVKAMETQYKDSLANNLEQDKQTAVLNAVLNNSKVSDVPEELLQARVDMYVQVYDKQYESYGTTTKEYMEAMGQDYEEYLEKLKTNIKESTETELILEAIADKEGLEADDEGYDEFIKDVLSSSGATDEKSFYEVYTVDGYDGERYFRQAYLTQKALDLCKDSAKYNGAPVEE